MNEEEPNKPPSSHRICPGCGKEFVTHHKNREYCNEVCYNTHYNSKIRNNQMHRLQQQNFCITAIRTLIGESKSAIVSTADLDSIGFPFDMYSNREKHSPISENHYVWYGPYRLNLTLDYQIQITLKNA